MTTYLYHIICSIILLGLVLTTHAQTVTNPYFYHNHELRCNCDPNNQCDTHNGTCVPDKCAWPYVGVSCQHADVLMREAPNVPPILLDGDDTTCLTAPWHGKVIYELDKPTHFIWAFVSRRDCEPMKPSLVLYNNDVNLNVQPYFLKIHPHSLLVKSRQDVVYTRLELSNLPEDTCTVEVSLGRNLAISSSSADISSVDRAVKIDKEIHHLRAIDGNDDPEFNNGSHCIHTDSVSEGPQWWKATFRHDARVNAVLVVNRNVFRCRMWESVFKLFTWNSKEVTRHVVPSTNVVDSPIYTFHVTVEEVVRRIEISVRKNTNLTCDDHGVMNLCEVYVYGEFRCPDGMYGALCEKSVPSGCSPDQCDPDWGCPRGCKDIEDSCTTNCTKMHGNTCELVCSKNCKGEGRCARYTGHCLEGCKPGYFRRNCTESCPTGYFGENCHAPCTNCKTDSSTNHHLCDQETGRCLEGCADGYTGNDCTRIEEVESTRSSGSSFPINHVLDGVFPGVLVLCLILCCGRSKKNSEDEEASVEGIKIEYVDTDTTARSSQTVTTFSDVQSSHQSSQGSSQQSTVIFPGSAAYSESVASEAASTATAQSTVMESNSSVSSEV